MKQLELFIKAIYANEVQYFYFDAYNKSLDDYQYTSNLGYTLHAKTLEELVFR